MTASDFSEFYRAVHNNDPFRWQARLAAQVMESGNWPDVIAMPTGTGKTSVLDIAVFHLAMETAKPSSERKAALRTFFVIDRRLVVDDVARHAEKLRNALCNPQDRLLREVAERLLSFGTSSPLEVAVLRGGMYRSDMWADQPNQPIICATTVDQIGSRLLFRGYGVSSRRQPIHAGLVGVDSLLIMDEAHLCRPFRDTLEQLQNFQSEKWRQVQVGHPLRCVHMSATPDHTALPPFELKPEDEQDTPLETRLHARKLAELRETSDFVADATREAQRLASQPEVTVIGVVANTVATARAIFEALRTKADSILLTGRIRPYDRDKLLASYLKRMSADRDRVIGDQLFVVATQTIEVGADLDFDALITEAAPLDSLRQRFGRLNRLGRRENSDAVVFKPKSTKGLEVLYGEPLERTWLWLNEKAETADQIKRIDFGVKAMSKLFAEAGHSNLVSCSEPGPVVLPALLDSWVQTHPQPQPDPDVAPFLHGSQALESADVQLVWRADLTGSAENWIDILSEVPPTVREALPLPLYTAKRWLEKERSQVADIEGYQEEPSDSQKKPLRSYILWRGPDSSVVGWPRRAGEKIERVRPGDTVVLHSDEGGCDDFGWNPDSTSPVHDIGDLCANERAAEGLGRYRLRIHPSVLFPAGEQRGELRVLLNPEDEDQSPDWERIREIVTASPDVKAMHEDLRRRLNLARAHVYDSEGNFLWVDNSKRKPQKPKKPDVLPEDSDENDDGSLTQRITLHNHTAGVHALTEQYARACGLPEPIVSDLRLAAKLHDIGKSDGRFQALLGQMPGEPLLAKGIGTKSPSEESYRREQAGYPKGARHEYASVALATGSKALEKAVDPELVLYLIGTHHGYGRSLPPFWREEAEFQIEAQVENEVRAICCANCVARVDSGWSDRFWNLTARYGHWGLAYLEAILRRADCMQSRKEEEELENGRS
jgi:CRISPR-associated endonuclease/helicase Cas3